MLFYYFVCISVDRLDTADSGAISKVLLLLIRRLVFCDLITANRRDTGHFSQFQTWNAVQLTYIIQAT